MTQLHAGGKFSDRNYELLETHAPFFIENGGDLPSRLLARTEGGHGDEAVGVPQPAEGVVATS